MRITINGINISPDGLNRLDTAEEINYELENNSSEGITQNAAQRSKEM